MITAATLMNLNTDLMPQITEKMRLTCKLYLVIEQNHMGFKKI
jgi:hypothetical protein